MKVVLDIETTGFSPRKSHIIEFAAILVNDSNQEIAAFSTLCKAHITRRITTITGITNADVQDEKPFIEYTDQIKNFLEDFPLIGHNIKKFDIQFLKRYGIGYNNYLIDTLEISRRRGRTPKHSLDFLCEYYKIKRTENHRGLHDARATHELYTRL